MSLIVAAGVGLAAGKAASGFIFNYTKNEYEQKIAEVEILIGRLQDHLADMKDLKEQINQFWHDEKAVEVYHGLVDTILETERQMYSAKKYMESLRTVVSELDGSSGVISQAIQDMMGAISAGHKG